jgi:hypothetical protein
MYPSSAPLVPDDRSHETGFIPRDLDEERVSGRQPRARAYNRSRIGAPSVGKRMAKSLVRFVAAILIGAGLTLGWQSYGDQVKEIAVSWAPALAWLLPATSASQTAEASASSDLVQQMKLIAVDVAIVRRNLGQLTANQEQLAAKQDQISQNIAKLQTVEQEIREQTLPPPPPPPKAIQPHARSLPQPPTQLQTPAAR